MDSLRSLLARRVRDARRRLGLTQQELARAAGFPAPQIISQIENGERDIKAWELVRLANALAVTTQDLLAQESPAPQPAVLWREPPRQNAAAREARFLQRHRQFQFVRRVTGAESSVLPPRPRRSVAEMSYQDAADLAGEVRKALDLGAYPAGALIEAAGRQYGIQAWYTGLEHDGSAACHVGSDGSASVLLNATEPPWRRTFSFAHELFHILTWDEQLIAQLGREPRLFAHDEKLANAFAAALLLPEDAVRRAVRQALAAGGMGYAALVTMAGEFGVSASALLWRLRNLGIYRRETVETLLADPVFGAMDAQSRRGSWWDPPPLPPRYVRLAYLAWQEGRLSRARLADYLDANLGTLDEELARYGLSGNTVRDDIDFSVNAADGIALEDQEWPVHVPGA
jgi:Zn-dependent peptidase ImmA (M78 family)/transcriptional regulator with XRE-family HTH domain